MRNGKVFRKLVIAVLLSVMLGVIPGTPALAAPIVTVSPASGAMGTMVTITGQNFDSYIGDNIYIYLDSTRITANPLIIPDTGSFSFSFNIPAGTATGEHQIRAKSALTTLALASFTVPETAILLDVKAGAVGTGVTVTGKGFYANRVVAFFYDRVSQDVLGTVSADGTGEFSFSFNIPDSTAGRHKIIAENTEGDFAEAGFEVIPLISLSPASGAVGELLTVRGTGFGARNDVSLYFRYTEVAYAKTNAYGNFEVAFNVPALAPGVYAVKAIDTGDNTSSAEFTITAGATLSRATGAVGTGLTVSGTGFIAGETVTIRYDDVTVATVVADGSGAFEMTFKVPAGQHGEHTVTVSDGTNIRELVFALESEPPPVPVLSLPAYNSEVKAETRFEWKRVVDPSSPVTYDLQVASGRNFASVVLEKRGLGKSEYTLSEEEKLAAVKKEAPYYWRVRAVDSAGNAGEWSSSGSFHVGFTMPGWVMYLLMGLGILVIGFLAFWLGRRTAYYQS